VGLTHVCWLMKILQEITPNIKLSQKPNHIYLFRYDFRNWQCTQNLGDVIFLPSDINLVYISYLLKVSFEAGRGRDKGGVIFLQTLFKVVETYLFCFQSTALFYLTAKLFVCIFNWCSFIFFE
jgi:hypothetical protein